MGVNEALQLMLVCAGAYIMPFVSRKLMLPSSVAELFFGMLIGTFIFSSGEGLGLIKHLSNVGFVLLMYIAGMELDFDRVSALHRREIIAYTGYALLLAGGSLAASVLTGMPVFFALVIMTSAVGMLFSVLKELNIVKTELGQTILLIGAICEVLTLIGITVVSLVAQTGGTTDTVFQVAGILVFVIVVLVSVRILRLFLWWRPEMKPFFMSVGGSSEIGVRANLFNMSIFVALAVFVDMEAILGAFFGGMVFALLFADREEMLERLSSFGYGFLIPLFFIEVGTRFKFTDFMSFEVIRGALLVTLMIFLVRCAATLPLMLTRLKKRELIYVPLAGSFPLTLLVAVSTMGEKLGIIDRSQSSVIILTAIITAIFYPWLMKIVNKAVSVS